MHLNKRLHVKSLAILPLFIVSCAVLDNDLRTKEVVRLDQNNFRPYFEKSIRDVNVVAFVVANRTQNYCSVCRNHFATYLNIWDEFAKQTNITDNLLFTYVDVTDQKTLDEWEVLDIPGLMLHKKGSGAMRYFHFTRTDFNYETFSKWVNFHTGLFVHPMKPGFVERNRIKAFVVGAVISVMLMYREGYLNFIWKKSFYLLALPMMVSLMISGAQFCFIKDSQAMFVNRVTNEPFFFYKGTDRQYGFETFFIAVMRLIALVCLIRIEEMASHMTGVEPRYVKVYSVVLLLCLTVSFTVLRLKNPNYPRLLFLF